MANQHFWKSQLMSIMTIALLSHGPKLFHADEGSGDPFEVVYEWKLIDYNWDRPEDKSIAERSGNYIPKNNAISGVKIWNDRAYLTVPRWLRGVPSTLNWVPVCPPADDGPCPRSPPLNPFPSWEMQQVGNCSAIQYVQAVEIDPLGRMWVLDVGRRNIITPLPNNRCHPKLLLLDLNQEGRVLHTHVFPKKVASRLTSFLNDLVVDVSGNPDGSDWFAYVTDSGGIPSLGGAIVVFHLGRDESWRVVDLPSMRARIPTSVATVGGGLALLTSNVDGIAMSPRNDRRDPQVYYSPLGSRRLYSLPTAALRNSRVRSAVPFVRYYGRKTSQSDGMTMDNEGNLYFGLLTTQELAVISDAKLESTDGEYIGESILFTDKERLQWVDGFGFDNEGSLWFITNRLQNLEFFLVDVTEVNYRLNRFRTGTKSYMYNVS